MLLMGPAVVAIAMLAKGGYGNSLAWLRRPPPAAALAAPRANTGMQGTEVVE
jgi:branched-chain amino acid transport system permease protein